MLRFMDSFDHMATGDIARKWTGNSSPGSVYITSGRFGNGMQLHDDNSRYAYIRNPGGLSNDVVIIGFAYRYTGIGDNSYFLLLDEAGVATHISFRLNSSTAKIQARFGTGTILGTGTTALSSSVWYYLEFKVKVHDSAGTVECRVNDNVEFALTGIDTKNGGTGVIDQIVLAGQGGFGSGDWTVDDLYICDDDASASGCDDFLGDVRVEALFANGAGATTDLAPSAGSNYQCVDDATPDDDSTYVESDVVGDKDTYTFTDLSAATATVFGIQIVPLAKKTDAGARKFKTVTRLSSTEVDGTEQTLGTSYDYFPEVQEEKPGGGAWTVTDVNAAQFGEKVTT